MNTHFNHMNTTSQHLPVDIVFHPSWWHAHAGITFDEDFFYHPKKRVESERRMEQVLYDRFGQYGLGEHRNDDLPVIYHGCGCVHKLLDAYNPLEAKADMDAVELRKQYGHRLGICGNSDIRIWERGDRDELKAEVLRKLNAAKGGGYIFQSDHSVASDVSGHTYDYMREAGT